MTVTRHGEQNDIEVEGINSGERNVVQASDLAVEGEEIQQAEKKAEQIADPKQRQKEKAANAAKYDRFGGAITLVAMCIVISALVILSILFLAFGKVSAAMHKRKKRAAHGVSADNAEDHHDELDSGEVIAAISMALAEHLGQGHDMEDTILTIRRMRKAYSPWNSKIYNMRVVPETVKPVQQRAPRKK